MEMEVRLLALNALVPLTTLLLTISCELMPEPTDCTSLPTSLLNKVSYIFMSIVSSNIFIWRNIHYAYLVVLPNIISGQVGITLNIGWSEPADSTTASKEASDRAIEVEKMSKYY